MEHRRNVWTANGQIEYILIRKNIKNLNLHIKGDGDVVLSVPVRCRTEQADEFIISKSDWIVKHLVSKEETLPLLPEESPAVLRARLELAVDLVYPLVKGYGVARPELKIRKMRSQWGNCHWAQGYITLNRMLSRCPEHLREYVALHELVHFLHHDHGAGFYNLMDVLMPDWHIRRRELKRYASWLRK